jgi:hypothetical protein
MPLPRQSSISSAARCNTGSGNTAGPALKLNTRMKNHFESQAARGPQSSIIFCLLKLASGTDVSPDQLQLSQSVHWIPQVTVSINHYKDRAAKYVIN